MNSEELDTEKIARCKKVLVENYFSSSIIEEVTNAIDFNETAYGHAKFLVFGKWWYIPRDWFTDSSIYPDMVFMDVGRGIATAEKKHIVDTILSNDKTQRIDLQTIKYNDIVNTLKDLIHSSVRIATAPFPKLVLFAPIEYFVVAYTDWIKEGLRLIPGTDRFVIDGFEIRPHWSSKYIDFRAFILYERTSYIWIAKPSVKDRLRVDIEESSKTGSMELKATTAFSLSLDSPEEVRVIRPTGSLESKNV
jgi:hypothetical protein